MRSSDLTKDQTYYLSSITESSLDMALFPLADMTKTQVREIAHAGGLHNASREESMGLCFVGERRRFNDFLGKVPLLSLNGFPRRLHSPRTRRGIRRSTTGTYPRG